VALDHIQQGREKEFRALAAQLTDYPLYPYLDYASHRRRLRELNSEEVIAFRNRWNDSPLGQRLYVNWIDSLIDHQRFKELVEHYEPDGNAARECHYLRAMIRSGQRDAAMEAVPALWVVGHSQPSVCDPLFNEWIEGRHLTQGMVWDRISLALEAGQIQLARYLTRYLKEPMAKRARDFVAVSQHPLDITQTSRFRSDTRRVRAIVSHGLRKLARIDAEAAAKAWDHYEDVLSFQAADAQAIDQDITRFLARRGILTTSPDLSPSPTGRHLETAEALVVAASSLGDWERAASFVEAVRSNDPTEPRWRYWLGRAHLAQSETKSQGVAMLQALAAERHYYGFLAAERLGIEGELNALVPPNDASVTERLRNNPGMRRVTELFAQGDLGNARREWQFLQGRLDLRERTAAAVRLAEIGWIDQSVIAASDPSMTHYISIRFPQPFRTLFDAASHATTLPIGFLYAIARQESAFGATAVSPVGALGLMQLMPATANLTARRIGDRAPSRADLLHPDVNVRLGSRHLAMLMKRYSGNRYLSAAAYNAGEHRVDRWLRERPLTEADLWIDSIPFLETRNYVKAVLAFSYIYGQLLENPTPFLDVTELGSAPQGWSAINSVTSSALNGQASSVTPATSTGILIP